MVDLPVTSGNQRATINNQQTSSVFATLIRRGIPLDTEVPVQQTGISLNLFYFDMQGNSIDPAHLKQGTDFECKVIVRNLTTREIDNLALTQVFPSGWEIINERLLGMEEVPNFEYRDIRDDRVMTYFRIGFNEQKEFRVRLNAAYAGSFLLPGAICESMYDNRISANVAAWRVEVIVE